MSQSLFEKYLPAERIKRLTGAVSYHDWRYYSLDNPVILDSEYDTLYKTLVDMERKHPELADGNSPTQRVPGAKASSFAPVYHKRPMYSLLKAHTIEEVLAWDKMVRRAAAKAKQMEETENEET